VKLTPPQATPAQRACTRPRLVRAGSKAGRSQFQSYALYEVLCRSGNSAAAAAAAAVLPLPLLLPGGWGAIQAGGGQPMPGLKNLPQPLENARRAWHFYDTEFGSGAKGHTNDLELCLSIGVASHLRLPLQTFADRDPKVLAALFLRSNGPLRLRHARLPRLLTCA
jgi:hypothetical protein